MNIMLYKITLIGQESEADLSPPTTGDWTDHIILCVYIVYHLLEVLFENPIS